MYPPYEYIRQRAPNILLDELLRLIECNRCELQKIRDKKNSKSQDVEKALAADLIELGFIHSATVENVPNLFCSAADFEMDFYSSTLKMAIEVEKGRNFNVWKDICKLVESPLVEHGVLIVPDKKIDSNNIVEAVFYNTIRRLHNVHRMLNVMQSLVVIGY